MPEEQLEIQNKVDGMIDFRRNASDVSRHVFSLILREQKLCVGFSVVLYDPDASVPDGERWAHAAYMPVEHQTPFGFRQHVKAAMEHIACGIRDIYAGTFASPDKQKEH